MARRSAHPIACPLSAWAAVAALLLLAACPAPVPGECLGAPGALCLSVRNGESFPRALRAVLEVRVGACDAVPPFPCQGGAVAPPVGGCKLSCQDVPAPERFTGADGRFTAEIDLSQSPGAGQASVRLYDGNDPLGREACAGQAALPFADNPGALVLDPRAAACPPRKKRCASHGDCGDDGQICSGGACAAPPAGACPPEMTLVPAGTFVLGSVGAANKDAACMEAGSPVRFTISKPFCLDRTEATVAQLRACVGQGCTAPMGAGCTYKAAGNDTLAANCLSWDQARAYCAFRSHDGQAGRLPTEAEWEWAAARKDKRRYPFGDEAPANICDFANGAGCEVAALKVRAPGQTPRGNGPSAPAEPWPALPLVDLSGNLAEWVADSAPVGLHGYCQLGPRSDPLNQIGPSRIVRGGSFADPPTLLYTYARNEYPAAAMMDGELIQRVGVRCALTPKLPSP